MPLSNGCIWNNFFFSTRLGIYRISINLLHCTYMYVMHIFIFKLLLTHMKILLQFFLHKRIWRYFVIFLSNLLLMHMKVLVPPPSPINVEKTYYRYEYKRRELWKRCNMCQEKKKKILCKCWKIIHCKTCVIIWLTSIILPDIRSYM